METEKIPEQTQQRMEAVIQEQNQVKELLRRGSIRHYFLGPENMWSQEGFGIVVGGGLTVFFGAFIFPELLLYSSSSLPLDVLCWAMTAIGIVILISGLYKMIKESKAESKPVPDEVHDEILECDIAGLRTTSKELLKEHIPRLKEEELIDEMEMLLVKGPRDYVHNVNLPLVWKRGDDGKLRYSNFSVMSFYFGKEHVYIYTCIYNMRNGMAKFPHTYECPYKQIRFVGFEDQTVETVNQKNKAIVQKLKMLVIDAGDEENEKLSMPVADYDAMERLKGTIDISDAEEAIRLLSERIKGVNEN